MLKGSLNQILKLYLVYELAKIKLQDYGPTDGMIHIETKKKSVINLFKGDILYY